MLGAQERFLTLAADVGVEGVPVFDVLRRDAGVDVVDRIDRAPIAHFALTALVLRPLGRSNALFALDRSVERVELAHDRVMALLELGGAVVVGVALDFFEGSARLGDQLLALLLHFAEGRHHSLQRKGRPKAADRCAGELRA
jgi:hypothetical protein